MRILAVCILSFLETSVLRTLALPVPMAQDSDITPNDTLHYRPPPYRPPPYRPPPYRPPPFVPPPYRPPAYQRPPGSGSSSLTPLEIGGIVTAGVVGVGALAAGIKYGLPSLKSSSSPSKIQLPSKTPIYSYDKNVPSSPSKEQLPSKTQIYFYDKNDPYYEFTNFSPHPVNYKGKDYPTSEHAFQAQKFVDYQPAIAEKIRSATRAKDAFDIAQKNSHLAHRNWFNMREAQMEHIIRAKFTQHAELKELLLSTKDAELIEDSPRDRFWGVGENGDGENKLGQILMKIRDEFRVK